ncbi:MAG: hypothetical protein L0I24_16690 [Pseudonocardia sp.]|nr:hypothetical protein [Pseudonocardia sp.]
MTAPRAGVLATARGRCAVCGPASPGWFRIVHALRLPGGADRWPCWHCSPAPGETPIPIFMYPLYRDVPRGGAA